MTQTAVTPTEERFGELTQLESLTSKFIAACNTSVEDGAQKFNAVKDYILKNTDLEENEAITTIFDEIARVSTNNPSMPTYSKMDISHVFASGYKESDPVYSALAHIGEARRAGKPAHLTPVVTN